MALGRELSYSNKDYTTLTADFERYLSEFLPEITDTSQSNPGRLLVQEIIAVVDNLHYAQDINFLESLWGLAQQVKNLISQAQGIPWVYPGPSAASTDLLFTQTGVITQIPRYLVCTTAETPPRKFVTIDSAQIVGGQATVAAVEGERVVEEVLTESASGALNQEYRLAQTFAPYQFVEIAVGGTPWLRQPFTLFDSSPTDQHFICRPEDDDPDITVIRFGNNEFGAAPPAGARITATYIRSSGEAGNTPANSITKIVGPVSGSFTVNNPEGAGGGSNGPDADTIREQAPFVASTAQRAVNDDDFLAIAVNVAGVFDAAIASIIGSQYALYIVPDGGGRASNTLIDTVRNTLQDLTLIGALVDVQPTENAELLIAADVYTRTTDIPRATVRQKVIDEILGALDYREIEIGRAFTISQLSKLILDIDRGSLVQAVNFTQLTRVPRVVQSDPDAPSIQGDVIVNPDAGYNDWTLVQLDATTFAVNRDGQVVGSPGTVGVEYTSAGGEVTFTLGTPTSVLPSSSTWSFSTSKYNGNIKIGTGEVPVITDLNQIAIQIFYPGEGTPFA